MSDNKFEFVNDVESDIVDPADMITRNTDMEDEKKLPPQAVISDDERWQRVQVIKFAMISILLSSGAFAFALIWQDSTTLLAICNAFWLLVVLQFAAGWMMLMNNLNILSPLIYGAQQFGKMVIGKRMKSDYYTYIQTKEENPIPAYYYITCFIGTLICAIPAIVLLFLVM